MRIRPGQARILIASLALLLTLAPVLSWSMSCCQPADPDPVPASAMDDCHDAGPHGSQHQPGQADSQTAPDCPECDHCVTAPAMPGIESALSSVSPANPPASLAIVPADSPPESPFKPPLA